MYQLPPPYLLYAMTATDAAPTMARGLLRERLPEPLLGWVRWQGMWMWIGPDPTPPIVSQS